MQLHWHLETNIFLFHFEKPYYVSFSPDLSQKMSIYREANFYFFKIIPQTVLNSKALKPSVPKYKTAQLPYCYTFVIGQEMAWLAKYSN